MTAVIVLLLSMAVPVVIAVLVITLSRRWQARDGRRSPQVDKLYHGPGEQLRRRIEEHDDEMYLALTMLFVIGPLLLASWGITHADWNDRAWLSLIVPVVLALVISAWAIHRLIKHGNARRRCREGLAAELMTAQNLLPVMANGCLLFHDIPANKFNIDHVVVGPFAVFAVETKSRKKPRGSGKQSAHVEYDGDKLHFPDHVTSRPIEQARHQARWLADYLRGAAGEPVPVLPVVALPGWFVVPGKNAHRADVQVINPKMHSVFFDKRATPISDSLRNRIAHALTQRYPDID